MIAILPGLAFSLITLPLILKFAHAKELYEHVDHRKLHEGSIPALGGVGIVVSFFAAVAVGYVVLERWGAIGDISLIYHGSILAGLLMMHLIGVVDDRVNIRAFRKFSLQLLAAFVIVAGGADVDVVRFPLVGANISLGAWGLPLTVLWIVSVVNAVNLIDGIDGFCGGVTVTAAAVFAVLAVITGNPLNAVLASAFIGAMGGFLVFNFPPARIFMGDGGSLFAGAFLATIAVLQGAPGGPGIVAAVPLVALTIPIIDTVAALSRRLRRRIPIHQPDREHFHHLLLDRAGSNQRALLVAYPVLLLLAAVVVFYAVVPGVLSSILLVAAPVAIGIAYVALDRRAKRLRLIDAKYPPTNRTAVNGQSVPGENFSGAAAPKQRDSETARRSARSSNSDGPGPA